jgi:hypothetical protein
MILYRPVGMIELLQIYKRGLRAFPPRLPEQPIFYPVLNLDYARQIARDWNTKSNSFAGYVTEFEISDEYGLQFEPHIVGGRKHVELWIPASCLNEFNHHLINVIKVVDAYFGKEFQGFIPNNYGLKGKNAVSQFLTLSNMRNCTPVDFNNEIRVNHIAVYINFPFWLKCDFTNENIDNLERDKTLQAVNKVWSEILHYVPLISY